MDNEATKTLLLNDIQQDYPDLNLLLNQLYSQNYCNYIVPDSIYIIG